MGFEEIKGQDNAINLIQAGFQTGRISHAYLFYGLKGIGKSSTARIFARQLNCSNSSPTGPCDTCPSCLKALTGNHPELIWAEPEGKNIKIGQMRTIREKAYYKCYEGAYKVIMIDEVQLLTEEAANCLLKVLEEPPLNTVFILIAQDTSALPTTLLSRCQQIPFKPLSENLIGEILKGKGIETSLPLSLAKGSVGKAIELINNYDGEQLVRNICLLLEGLPTMSYQDIFSWAEKTEKERELVEASLDIMGTVFRDQLVAKSIGNDQMLLLGQGDYLSTDIPKEKCLQALDIITRSQDLLNRNANTRLVLEVLLINLRNIESKERGANPIG